MTANQGNGSGPYREITVQASEVSGAPAIIARLASVFVPDRWGRDWQWYRRVQGGRWARVWRSKALRGSDVAVWQPLGWMSVPVCPGDYPESYTGKVRSECTKTDCYCEEYS